MSNYGVIASYDPMQTNTMNTTFVPPSLTPQSAIRSSYTNPYSHTVTNTYTPPLQTTVTSFSPPILTNSVIASPAGITSIPPPTKGILRKTVSVETPVVNLAQSVNFNENRLVETVRYRHEQKYCDECFCSLI